MRLESVRALKAELLEEVPRTGVVSRMTRAGATEPSPGVALGIDVLERHRKKFKLSVTVRDRSAVVDGYVDRIRKAASGEVSVRVSGPVRPMSQLVARSRPLQVGYSVGHLGQEEAGTLGAFVSPKEASDPVPYVLSNNHVIARCNTCRPGAVIIQPGGFDGGSGNDRIGVLDRYVPIISTEVNVVDAALGRIDEGINIQTPGPGGVGYVREIIDVVECESGLAEKVGRSTGCTSGVVRAIEIDQLSVEYPGLGHVRFDGQIMLDSSPDLKGPFGAAGDSGSVIYDPLTRSAYGLLFAGSPMGGQRGGGLTFANPLADVMDALDIELSANQVEERP